MSTVSVNDAQYNFKKFTKATATKHIQKYLSKCSIQNTSVKQLIKLVLNYGQIMFFSFVEASLLKIESIV
mgnify:CR=1 FL=1